jgi:hypothetical protein
MANRFEIEHGTHTRKAADRLQSHVLPFFSQHLCFSRPARSACLFVFCRRAHGPEHRSTWLALDMLTAR